MVKRTVVWTETAKLQRREILKYWTLRNRSRIYAEKLMRLTKKRVETILDNPFSGKSTDHSDTRESAMGHFSIYYRVTPHELIVMAFWDNRQDPDKLLGLLTKKS